MKLIKPNRANETNFGRNHFENRKQRQKYNQPASSPNKRETERERESCGRHTQRTF